ncbi:hypothetical protein BGP75_16025 [Motiliproteus sp. MSK22-1]|nr:hypothetical protein BGP75_16025 [Motiliproteus sp. MSK22-1]
MFAVFEKALIGAFFVDEKYFRKVVDDSAQVCRIRPHVVAEGGNRSPAKPKQHQVLQRLIEDLTEVND